jgi:aminopeptidase N
MKFSKYLIIMSAAFSSCTTVQKVQVRALPEVKISANKNRSIDVLKSAKDRTFDLLHTSLDLVPLWKTEQMSGKAVLTMKPYFYPTNEIVVDAKKMDLHEIKVILKGNPIQFQQHYDSVQLILKLDQWLTTRDTVQVMVNYTSNPNRIEKGGSKAIKEDKGLYFINASGADTAKPRHLWTQGETQANSCWFPTFDSPNEKHSQDVKITVEKELTTLCNGVKINSIINGDGTRTDHWEQQLPHSVYLTVVVVGKFDVIKDKWRDKEVSYYMEPKYASMARPIFGRTPEMMEYFSNLLGVSFPWDKYAQVIVHDFVAGAMENTSAVTFHNFVQKDKRELIDNNDDETIAHELFHHWFGDLVTCESWSHLPLNESFANYSEHLWFEHKYGRAHADYIGYKDLDDYIKQSGSKVQPLIRFDYQSQEDMFDVLSYNKGGRILHQLRKQIGDEAFFKSLQLYLSRYSFKTAEIANLRQCFEEITGKDLNRYFNQWFFVGGHPILTIHHEKYAGGIKITTHQKHSLEDDFIYELPLEVDFYFDSTMERKTIVLNHVRDTFLFSFDRPILLANVDAEKSLVGEKNEEKSITEYIAQFRRAPLYLDKLEAIRFLKQHKDLQDVQNVFTWGLNSKMPWIVVECLRHISIKSADSGKLDKLTWLAQYHKTGIVRAAAIEKLAKINAAGHRDVFVKMLQDSSYKVEAAALSALYKADAAAGLKEADRRMVQTNFTVKQEVLNILSLEGDSTYYAYFVNQLNGQEDYKKSYIMSYFGTYFATQNQDLFGAAIQCIQKYKDDNKDKWYGKTGFERCVSNAIKAISSKKEEEYKRRLAILNSIL